ncbi:MULTISPECIES: hypothetical protein [Clostridium]|nr:MULTISPECIES: hypothetical protein [Clostridium]
MATCLVAAVVGFIGAFISEKMVKKRRRNIEIKKGINGIEV